jgi:endonuclease YncB( thermonuclease family)
MSDILYVKQKASKWTRFGVMTLSICAPTIYANNCTTEAKHFKETVKVAHIYDGDTIKLTDGRKVRLIGINTPERGRNGNKDQPFYLSAKNQLQKIIKNNHHQLNIVLGNEKHDRYQRLLAHIFTPDGKNISATLLKKGLGFSITVPPNLKFHACYKNAETDAQKNKRGIWSHSFSNPIQAPSISKNTLGFQRVTGTVKRVGESHSSYWLNLDTNFALRIQKKHLKYFTSYHPKSLIKKRLIARGWIYQQKNELRMSIQHPASLQIQNTD